MPDNADRTLARDICTALDAQTRLAGEILHRINERDMQGEGEEDNLDKEILSFYVGVGFQKLLVALDALHLADTRRDLLQRFSTLQKQNDFGGILYKAQWDNVICPALSELRTMIDSIRPISGEIESPLTTTELQRLERILRDTGHLLHRRSITPTSEKHIRDVMHDYLSVCFSQYTTSLKIAGMTKTFIPDGGVIDLKAAIEFKFARDATEVKKSLSGIFEDVSGYAGSADWTRFYAVIYMTGPYASEDVINADLRRVGATSWRAFLVNGAAQAREP